MEFENLSICRSERMRIGLSAELAYITLVVTFLAFKPPDIIYSYAIPFPGFDLVVISFVDAVELVARSTCRVNKVHFRFAVTVHAPTHAKLGKLLHFVHFLDISMTCLTGDFSSNCVLRVVEVNVVRKVMDFNPFNWLASIFIRP